MEGRRTKELRAELIREWKEGESVTALAEAYGVSRKTIYKWLGRHESEGTAGLADRSRAPHNSPLKVSAEMIAHIIETRSTGAGPAQTARQNGRGLAGGKDPIGQHGGRGIARQRPESCAQAPATDATLRGAILRMLRNATEPGARTSKAGSARGMEPRCDPLTITDAYSRFLLCCQIRSRLTRACGGPI